ncbi:DUF3368 domain-containing protein [uncultured Imperialibacter sp.]|uniref:DUF3368 domain-containing protein n=1 Tax=uncultured Imperialibacter sp. TaxID=1672639 RepID=UPI0030D72446|tara:strand:- start:67430 stop:67885 length:456 start_codon:yes stop_codon:yes gene_type:complete
MAEIIISDTSCLIAYQRIDRLDILQKLFHEVIITEQVLSEFGYAVPEWIKVKSAPPPFSHSILETLDLGEASSISLALKTPGSILILDERKGRKVATDLGLEIIGSIRVLLLAKDKKIIPSVREMVDQLSEHKFRFSTHVVRQLLIEAGEA